MQLVVSGLTPAGKAAVVSSQPVTDLTVIPGMSTVAVRDLWVSAGAPADLGSPDIPAAGTIGAPAHGGHIVRLLAIEPDPPDHDVMSGWHSTPTLDHVVVLSGEIVCIFDDGDEVVLRAGDVLVQRGVEHAWSNRTDTTCRMLGILVDANPA